MILADTSAWVEYDRATGSRADQRIAELIADDGPLMFTEPVLMEVFAGARSDARQEDLRRMLLRFGLAHFDAVTDFDCMIAAVAYRRALALLAWDADMFRVAEVIGIDVDEASLRVG